MSARYCEIPGACDWEYGTTWVTITPPAYVFGAHWAPNGFTFLHQDKLTGHPGDLVRSQ